jgi:hypothetical protein
MLNWKGFGWSLLALMLGMVLIVLIAQLAWGPVKAAYEEEISLNGGFEKSSSWLAGFMLAAVGLMIAWIAFVSRRVSGTALVTAGIVIYLLVWLAVWMGMDADNPLTTAYLSWPLLGGVTGMAALTVVGKTGFKLALLSLAAFMVMALLIPEMWMSTYTREDAWIPVLAACLPMGLLAPQFGMLFGKD